MIEIDIDKHTINLEVSDEEIARRIPNLATRGITLAPGQTLKDLYDYRTPIYERAADITVDAENCTIEQTARAIQGAAKD